MYITTNSNYKITAWQHFLNVIVAWNKNNVALIRTDISESRAEFLPQQCLWICNIFVNNLPNIYHIDNQRRNIS